MKIREATKAEYAEIGQAYAEHVNAAGGFLESPADLPDSDIYIREDFVSDSPGFVGAVALMHWRGAPGAVSILAFAPAGAGYAWRFESETPAIYT